MRRLYIAFSTMLMTAKAIVTFHAHPKPLSRSYATTNEAAPSASTTALIVTEHAQANIEAMPEKPGPAIGIDGDSAPRLQAISLQGS